MFIHDMSVWLTVLVNECVEVIYTYSMTALCPMLHKIMFLHTQKKKYVRMLQ